MLGDPDQLMGLRNVGLKVKERRSLIAGGEAVDGRGRCDRAVARSRARAREDLGGATRPRDPLGERGGQLIVLVLADSHSSTKRR